MKHLAIFTFLFLACSMFGCDKKAANKTGVEYVDETGATVSMDEMAQRSEGTYKFEVGDESEVIPPKANELHQLARAAGGSGDYEKSIKLLEEAHEIAPTWPYPIYDMAFTYLLMDETDKAREKYRETLALAPRGFFTTIAALDTLDREASGDLPAGVYKAYMSLEWVADPAEKKQMIEFLIQKFPNFAPAWKEFALIQEDEAEKLKAIEKGLACNPDLDTKGILQINKYLTLYNQGEVETSKKALSELAESTESTFSTQ